MSNELPNNKEDTTEQLCDTCDRGDYENAVKLLDQGANVNGNRFGPYDGLSPLVSAAEFGYTRIVQLLISRGANLNQTSGYYCTTAINSACMNGHIDCVRLLIDAGCDLTITNKERSDPVLFACLSGNVQILELLLEHGAELSLGNLDRYWSNAMHNACSGAHVDMIKYLLDKGFSLDSPEDRHGRTPRMNLPKDVNIDELLLKN